MNIVIDAMGTEKGPSVIIDGINEIAEEIKDCKIHLIGDSNLINESLHLSGKTILPKHEIVHTENNVTMLDSPTKALANKMDSSIAVGLKLARDLEKSVFISMGNTGAVMAFSLKIFGRIKGIFRPALGTIFPAARHPLFLDFGATPDCKPEILYQFAVIGSEYMKSAMGIKDPVIGLLSIGSEEKKGSILTQKTFEMISNDNSLNFYGNIEGNDIFKDKVDVIVCDGFVGNVILKFGEGIVDFIMKGLKEVANSSIISKAGMGLAKNGLKKYFQNLSYDEYGGALLLGVDGISIIGHGNSNVKAISSSVLYAKKLIEHDFIDHVKEKIEKRSGNEN